MKKLPKYFFLWLLVGLLSYPTLAQNTDNEQDTEVLEEEENFSQDIIDQLEQEYDEQHEESIPWTPNSQDDYLKENLSRKAGANQTWERTRKKLKYKQEKEKKRKKKQKDSLNGFTGQGWGQALRWVFIVLGIIIILALIVYLAQGGNFRQGQKIHVDISDEKIDWIEENLPQADVQSPLDAAIASKQYRKAIRLYFLLIIQKLTLAEEIDWQKEKTNRTYILETYNKDFHNDFRTCVRIYERVWYGERSVNDDEFAKIEPVFKELAHRFIIQNTSHAE